MSTLITLLSEFDDKYLYDGEYVRYGKLQHDLRAIKDLDAKLAESEKRCLTLLKSAKESSEMLIEAIEVIKFYAEKCQNPERDIQCEAYDKRATDFLAKLEGAK